MVGVDTFGGSSEHASLFDGTMPAGLLVRECWLCLQEAGVLDEVTLITAPSLRACGLFADENVWAVLLDADHSEESVAADIAAWWPKVTPGGLMGGDDYHVFPGVKAAVDARFSYAAWANLDRCWWQVNK